MIASSARTKLTRGHRWAHATLKPEANTVELVTGPRCTDISVIVLAGISKSSTAIAQANAPSRLRPVRFSSTRPQRTHSSRPRFSGFRRWMAAQSRQAMRVTSMQV